MRHFTFHPRVHPSFPILTAATLLIVAPVTSTASREAHATHRGSVATPVLRGNIRIAHPASSIDFVFGNALYGATDLAGGSLGISVLEKFTLEGGGGWRLGNLIYGSSFHVYSRVGYMPVIFDARDGDHRGPTLQLGGKFGYHYIVHGSWHEAEALELKVHGLTLGAALDYSHWFKRHLGIVLGFILEGGLPVWSRRSEDWDAQYGEPGGTLTVGFSAGVAF